MFQQSKSFLQFHCLTMAVAAFLSYIPEYFTKFLLST